MVDEPAPSATPSWPAPLWLVGAGQMGGALVGSWRRTAPMPAPSALAIIDPRPEAGGAWDALRVDDPGAALARTGPPQAVLLAVKPQQASALVPPLADKASGALLVSAMAGVRWHSLVLAWGSERVVRTMPNLALAVGCGVTALFGPALAEADRQAAQALFAPGGQLVWLDDENRFDALTALSGSGPAYVFRMVEAMAGAGEAAGLEPQQAVALARATLVGAAALLEASPLAAGQLRQQVTSPGGTTEAGLDVLDGDGALSALMRATVRAAADRSRLLGQQMDGALAARPSERERAGGLVR